MSRVAFQLYVLVICAVALLGSVGFALGMVYWAVGFIEPDWLFDHYDWVALHDNELFCRLRKEPYGASRWDNRDTPPRAFSDAIMRERLAALPSAREKVRDQSVEPTTVAAFGCLCCLALYLLLLWRVTVSLRPRPNSVVVNSNLFLIYLRLVRVLGWAGCVGSLVGIGFGVLIILQPDLKVHDDDLERYGNNKNYWQHIGQRLGNNGFVDIHQRPSEDEITRGRLQGLEVVREEKRNLARSVIVVSAASLVLCLAVLLFHRRLNRLVRLWRPSEPTADSRPAASAPGATITGVE